MTDKVRPRDFPYLMPVKVARKFKKVGQVQPCSVCHLAVSPRNRKRHVKACARRKRLAPAMWREWKLDMLGASKDDERRPSDEALAKEDYHRGRD